MKALSILFVCMLFNLSVSQNVNDLSAKLRVVFEQTANANLQKNSKLETFINAVEIELFSDESKLVGAYFKQNELDLNKFAGDVQKIIDMRQGLKQMSPLSLVQMKSDPGSEVTLYDALKTLRNYTNSTGDFSANAYYVINLAAQNEAFNLHEFFDQYLNTSYIDYSVSEQILSMEKEWAQAYLDQAEAASETIAIENELISGLGTAELMWNILQRINDTWLDELDELESIADDYSEKAKESFLQFSESWENAVNDLKVHDDKDDEPDLEDLKEELDEAIEDFHRDLDDYYWQFIDKAEDTWDNFIDDIDDYLSNYDDDIDDAKEFAKQYAMSVLDPETYYSYKFNDTKHEKIETFNATYGHETEAQYLTKELTEDERKHKEGIEETTGNDYEEGYEHLDYDNTDSTNEYEPNGEGFNEHLVSSASDDEDWDPTEVEYQISDVTQEAQENSENQDQSQSRQTAKYNETFSQFVERQAIQEVKSFLQKKMELQKAKKKSLSSKRKEMKALLLG